MIVNYNDDRKKHSELIQRYLLVSVNELGLVYTEYSAQRAFQESQLVSWHRSTLQALFDTTSESKRDWSCADVKRFQACPRLCCCCDRSGEFAVTIYFSGELSRFESLEKLVPHRWSYSVRLESMIILNRFFVTAHWLVCLSFVLSLNRSGKND